MQICNLKIGTRLAAGFGAALVLLLVVAAVGAMGSADLSNRTEQQAAALEQAPATMDQLTATHEQANGIAQVSQAVGEMDRATQQNAAWVEQSAAAAESLSQQAQVLMSTVSRFKLKAA